MSHQHDHGVKNYNAAFIIGITLNVAFVIIEAVYGFAVNSLALISDAGHNLSDVFGLVLAWGGSWLAKKSPTVKRTYGFRRATILASLASAILLLIALGAISWEAIIRLQHPQPVNSMTVIVVAGIGVVINTLTALLFMSGRNKDLNIKGAYLHMAADAAVSLGVVFAGVVIMETGWWYLDPAVSLLIAVIIFWGTWGLLRDSLNLSLDAVPRHIDPTEVEAYLREIPQVSGLHDLHIWAMSTTEVALTAHIVVPETVNDQFLNEISRTLHDRFEIEHSTLQVEQGSDEEACRLSHPDSL